MKVRALVARDDEFDYGSDLWDLIVMTYVRDLNRYDAERFWKALKPGGIVIYENGANENNSVLRAFLDFQIIRFEDIHTTPDWESREQDSCSAADCPEDAQIATTQIVAIPRPALKLQGSSRCRHPIAPFLTHRSAGEHQVGDVHASGQQNQTGQNHHRGEWLRKLRPKAASHHLHHQRSERSVRTSNKVGFDDLSA